jgi:hypothetical protein
MNEIEWKKVHGNSLRAILVNDKSFGVSETYMDYIQTWCVEHNCGIRTSFDTFKFKKPEHMSIFLIRWS